VVAGDSRRQAQGKLAAAATDLDYATQHVRQALQHKPFQGHDPIMEPPATIGSAVAPAFVAKQPPAQSAHWLAQNVQLSSERRARTERQYTTCTEKHKLIQRSSSESVELLGGRFARFASENACRAALTLRCYHRRKQ
jgi:hypothetical protein